MKNILIDSKFYEKVKTKGKQWAKKLILTVASFMKLDLLLIAYNDKGILKYQNSIVSGEHYFANEILKKYFGNNPHPVLFDVGANVGDYSQMLLKAFPDASIYAFEPNINTYKELSANLAEKIKCINVGLGSEEKMEKIYTYSDDLSSQHASVHRNVFRNYYKRDDILSFDFKLSTLDVFCEQEEIAAIDFLKIDTEGNELSTLQGAKQILSEGRIKIIQFEFGECDLSSHVYLKDFYDILNDFLIYRLDTERLIPMFEYSYANEIFRYQNIIAINRKIIPGSETISSSVN